MPAMLGLFPLLGVCLLVNVVLLMLLFGDATFEAAHRLTLWTLVVIGNGSLIGVGVYVIRMQLFGDRDWFRVSGAVLRYPLLLAASYFTVVSPGRVVAVLWLWWAATSFMGCKAR
jgi:hypothetical protein